MTSYEMQTSHRTITAKIIVSYEDWRAEHELIGIGIWRDGRTVICENMALAEAKVLYAQLGLALIESAMKKG